MAARMGAPRAGGQHQQRVADLHIRCLVRDHKQRMILNFRDILQKLHFIREGGAGIVKGILAVDADQHHRKDFPPSILVDGVHLHQRVLLQKADVLIIQQLAEHRDTGIAGVVAVYRQAAVHRLGGVKRRRCAEIRRAGQRQLPVEGVLCIIIRVGARVRRLHDRIIDGSPLNMQPAAHVLIGAVQGVKLGEHPFRGTLRRAAHHNLVAVHSLQPAVDLALPVRPDDIEIAQHTSGGDKQQHQQKQYGFQEKLGAPVALPRQDCCQERPLFGRRGRGGWDHRGRRLGRFLPQYPSRHYGGHGLQITAGQIQRVGGCEKTDVLPSCVGAAVQAGRHDFFHPDTLFVGQGDVYRADRLALARIRPGHAGDADADRGFARLEGAHRHSGSDLRADGAVFGDHLLRYAEQVVLDFGGIRRDAALKHRRCAGHLGEPSGQQPRRTGLRRGDLHVLFLQQLHNRLLERTAVHTIHIDAEPLTDFRYHRFAHRPGGLLIGGARGHPQYHLALLGVGGHRGIGAREQVGKPLGHGRFRHAENSDGMGKDGAAGQL